MADEIQPWLLKKERKERKKNRRHLNLLLVENVESPVLEDQLRQISITRSQVGDLDPSHQL